ncbi:NADPH:quinone oxidoreductase 2 [Salmonella enterica subsp. enterica serovar Madelia]|nr:NADPH:quinone oxidoreductase 2 [Salmonella enterica subsp. enterica serovar Madelia]
MIAITGATGQLGQHVIENLLKTTPASHLVAIVRNSKKAAPLSQRGIAVRQADYANEAALTTALQGVDKLLLISSSEVGPTHRAAPQRHSGRHCREGEIHRLYQSATCG